MTSQRKSSLRLEGPALVLGLALALAACTSPPERGAHWSVVQRSLRDATLELWAHQVHLSLQAMSR